MSENGNGDDLADVEVARIEVVRSITGDGDEIDLVRAVDDNGDPLPLAMALGMLRLAEDTLIRVAMGDDRDP